MVSGSNPSNNVYIDSVWFNTPVRQLNQPDKLMVRVRNLGDDPAENVPIKLMVNGRQKAVESPTIDPNSYLDTALYFTSTETGIMHAIAELTDYPITYDDRFMLAFDVAESIPVLCINEVDTNPFIRTLFGNDPFFELTQTMASSLDYSSIDANKLVVLAGLNEVPSGLQQALDKFTINGGHVVVMPGTEIDLDSYREFLLLLDANPFTGLDTTDTQVDLLNSENPVFENVFERIPDNMDLPVVSAHYQPNKRINTAEEYLLKLRTSENFLSMYTHGNGRVYVCVSPLDGEWSNFPRHALFVPILYKMALNSNPTPRLYHTIGRDESVELNTRAPGGDNTFHVADINSDLDFIPEHRILNNKSNLILHGQLREAGNYQALLNEEPVAGIAFNYDRKESDLTACTEEEIANRFQQAGLTFSVLDASEESFISSLNELREGKKYWKHCIVLVLLFLGLEVALLKLWK